MSFRRTAVLIGIAALWNVTSANAQTPAAAPPAPAPAPPPGTTPVPTPEPARTPGPGDTGPAPAPAREAGEPAPTPPATSAPAAAETPVAPPIGAAPPAPQGELPKPPSAPSTPTVSKWKVTIYGMVEFNAMHDSTQSLGESVGGTALRRKETFAGSHSRMHFTSRNSRFGVKVNAPDFGDVKTSGVMEMDFFGYTAASEAAQVSSGTFRLRQAFVKMDTPVVDLLVGQTYHVFGWQPFFFPATTSFFPIMNMVFGRMPQFRVSKTVKSDAVTFDIAAAAVRPPQRDSGTPDGQAGLKLGINSWKGIHSLGAGTMLNDALSIGVSGLYRHFRLPENTAPQGAQRTTNGYGLSIDAFIPVIPAASVDDAGNALSLTGSFSISKGAADVLGVMQANNLPTTVAITNADGTPGTTPYVGAIDAGLVRFNTEGKLKPIGWQTFMVGAQYYLPPSGSVFISANYTQSESKDITTANLFANTVYNKGRYIDGNILIDFTKAFRLGLSYQYSWQRFTDGATAKNHRKEISAYMFF
ncbi:MAG TPA: hypothetical protein VFQ61_35420 [Polyangiaceae bacterium]|nr:hypothetical protein [Polyangiaceae bacterium]